MFDKLKKRLKGTFLGHFLTLFSGNAISQAIGLAAIPLITRLYDPAEFGTFSLFVSIGMVLNQLCTLRYERAVILPKDEISAINVASLSTILLFLCCLAMLGCVALFQGTITSLLNNEQIGPWLYLLPVMIFFRVILRLVMMLNLRWKRFMGMTSANVTQAFSTSSMKLGLGYFWKASPGGLIIGEIAGIVCAIAMLLYKAKYGLLDMVRNTSVSRMREMAKEYSKFAIYGTPTTLLNYVSRESVVILLSAFFTPAVVGFYGLSNRVINRPINLLVGSMSSVYHQRLAEMVNNKAPVFPRMRKFTIGLALASLPPTIILAVAAAPIFGFIFGDDWRTAGTYVQVMSPMFFALFVLFPANLIYEVCQRQELRLVLNAISAGLRIASIAVTYLIFDDPLLVVAAFTAAYFVMEMVIMFYALRIAVEHDRGLQQAEPPVVDH